MEIEEIKNGQFIKEYKITVPFQDINSKVEEKVNEAAKTFKMPGFREGKVPLSIVRQKVGKSETTKQIQAQVSLCVKDLIEKKGVVPLSKPNIEVSSFNEDDGLVIKVAMEVFPKIPEIKWQDIEIEKIIVDKPSNDKIEESKNALLKDFREHKEAEDQYRIKNGDKVNIDFHGKIEGKDFDGNKDEKMDLVIGNNDFLQEFEENLIGCKVGEEKSFAVVFPEDYPQKDLALKKADFKVKINKVMKLDSLTTISSEMLKKLGVESEEKLNQLIKQKLELDSANTIRMKMKKDLFDKIDKEYDFDFPEKMVEQDFSIIWKEVEKNKEKDENLKNKSEKELESEYRRISKRRVKIGLIIAEVARKNDITATDDEVKKIVEAEANKNQQIKERILEFYKNPENLEKIKGPILEEKVLDFIFSKIKLKLIKMTSEEFSKDVLSKMKSSNLI